MTTKLSKKTLEEYLNIIKNWDTFLEWLYELLQQWNLELNSEFFAILDKAILEAKTDSEKEQYITIRQQLLQIQEREAQEQKETQKSLEDIEKTFDDF